MVYLAGTPFGLLDSPCFRRIRRSRAGLWDLSGMEGGEPGSHRVFTVRINWSAPAHDSYHHQNLSGRRNPRLHLQFYLLLDLPVERFCFSARAWCGLGALARLATFATCLHSQAAE